MRRSSSASNGLFNRIFCGALCAALVVTSAVSPSIAEAAKSKKTKSSQKKVAAPEGVPTVLPAFKGPKKIKIDFTDESNAADNNKVVQSNSALEKAISDNKAARTAVESNNAKIEIVQSIPVAGVPEKGSEKPKIAELSIAPKMKPVASPSPAPMPLVTKATPAPLASPTPVPVATANKALAPSTAATEKTASDTDTPNTPVIVKAAPKESVAPTTAETASAPSTATAATSNSSAPSSSSTFTPAATSSRWAPNFIDSTPRFYLRGGYLGAKYSDLESRLENGATMIGFGIGAELRDIEGRLSLDIVHGKDQAVTPQNIRMITARVDANFLFLTGAIRPFVGGGLGYSDYDVRSYRSVNGNDIAMKQHAKGGALSAMPHAGVRFGISRILSLNLELEYQALVGKSEATSLGGLSGIGTVGFSF